eukprot:2718141-Pyramimonas_sp.AAC.1
MSNPTNASCKCMSFSATLREHGSDRGHSSVEDALWHCPRVLTAAQVVVAWSRWVDLNAAVSDQ